MSQWFSSFLHGQFQLKLKEKLKLGGESHEGVSGFEFSLLFFNIYMKSPGETIWDLV